MSPDKENLLRNTYPNLYRPIYNGCHIPFECDDGWFDLIKCLSERLDPMIAEFLQDDGYDDWAPHPVQIKEKYGTLRFYMTFATDEILKIVDEYETQSEKICEVCGEVGRLNQKGYWYSTRCDQHRDE